MTTLPNASPRWGSTLKLVVGLTLILVVAGLLIKFQSILPQIFLIIIIAYLINPIADLFTRKVHTPWKISVTIVYIIIFFLFLGLAAISGVSVLQQLQNILQVLNDSVDKIPQLLTDFSARSIQFGPFTFDLKGIDINSINDQIISSAQPLLTATGTVLTAFAGSAASFLGWALFVLLASYFILVQNDEIWEGIFTFHVPGYDADLHKIGTSISKIWNSFLRGQVIVMTISAIIYAIVLSMLGVSSALGIAIFAGLARFVPYVGPFILWVILALTCYFQEFQIVGMEPWSYALLVVGIAWIIDGIMDNIVMPRILASSLEVHPALILIGAIIGLDLLGILGVIIAAPLVASVLFFGKYIFRKLFDMDPWAGMTESPPPISLRQQLLAIFNRYKSFFVFKK
jgi:predicted PurR-regulated permease PerM